MTWTGWQPAAPTSLNATLAEGGTLLANTTYYIRVVALDSGNTYRSSITNEAPHIYSPYSDVITIATDATRRSIALTWAPSVKRDGVTQVDGYDVLVATDPAQFGIEHAQIAAGTSYYNPPTLTNSYTITAPPTLRFKRIPNGQPEFKWDGVGTATLDNLYAWMIANGWGAFVKPISTLNGDSPIIGYMILGGVVISPEKSGGYALTIENQWCWIFGRLFIESCKVKLRRAVLFLSGNSHSEGADLRVNAAGSTVESTVIEGAFGVPGDAVYVGTSRSWGGDGPIWNTRAPYERFSGNFLASGGGVIDLMASAPLVRPHPINKLDGGASSQNTNAQWLAALKTGQHIIQSDRAWNLGVTSFCQELNNTNAYWQFPAYNLIDFHAVYENYQGRAASRGLDHWLNTNSYYGRTMGNRVTTFHKRFRVIALDEHGQPLAGAKVTFMGAGGQNLAQGNTLNDSVRLAPGYPTDGFNWQEAEATIRHDDTEVWLSVNTGGTGPNGPTPGDTYWWKSERLRLVEQIEVGTENWRKWRVERGLTNTVPGWLVYDQAYLHFIRAPEHHLTGEDGEVWNVTCMLVIKNAYNPPNYEGWLYNLPANVGELIFYAPITVRVEAPGYDLWEATYPLELLESVGVKPFTAVAQLVPETPPIYIEANLTAEVNDEALTAQIADDAITVEVREWPA